MATTIRISPSSHEILKEESKSSGRSMQSVLDEAIEQFRRRRFISEVNASFAQVREDERAWGEVLKEREAWDTTTMDGLGDE